MSEIKYITKSEKPYPEWMKNHRVFSSIDKINKVFPMIGLYNFSEDIDIFSTKEAVVVANNLRYYFYDALCSLTGRLRNIQAKYLGLSGKERNIICNKTQELLNNIDPVLKTIDSNRSVVIVREKVSIVLSNDVFNGMSSKPIFKLGECLFRVVGKINKLIDQLNDTVVGVKEQAIALIEYENNDLYKKFSSINVPGKKYKMVFSSTGPSGAWDIATSSMRGITSCQSWNSPQSRGLIGSIVSKYVGTIYVLGSQDFPPYGKQMIYRALVRFLVNKISGAPALFVDIMYPSYNEDFFNSFKETLEKRSGLKVFSANKDGDIASQNYFVLDERSRGFLREGEFSYMDRPFQVKYRDQCLISSNIDDGVPIKHREEYFINKLISIIKDRQNNCIDEMKSIELYNASAEISNKEETAIDPAFQGIKKECNFTKSTLNFLAHFNRKNISIKDPTLHFAASIFKEIRNENKSFSSSRECDMWIFRKLITDKDRIMKKSWEVLSTGSWMKAFPRSSKRFHETVFNDLKNELMLEIKGK